MLKKRMGTPGQTLFLFSLMILVIWTYKSMPSIPYIQIKATCSMKLQILIDYQKRKSVFTGPMQISHVLKQEQASCQVNMLHVSDLRQPQVQIGRKSCREK